jgi:hypothetical protein
MPSTTNFTADLLSQSAAPLDLTIPANGNVLSQTTQNPLQIPVLPSSSSLDPVKLLSELPTDLSQPETIDFTSGFFTVGSTGQVGIDNLLDGGDYAGETAIFSLTGLEKFGTGTDFFKETARRALSNSTAGHVVIRDQKEGARFPTNSTDYLGVKTFAMTPGDTFGIMLVPNGTVQEVFDNPGITGDKRPLFSLVTANPNDAFHLGQIADVMGTGSTFALEDLRVDLGSDKDYNDVVFQVRGAIGTAISLDEMMPFDNDWRDQPLGQALLDYAAAYDNPRLPQPIRYGFPPATNP